MTDPRIPFVVLLGLPGTGKTQAMIAAAKAYDKPGAVITLLTFVSNLSHKHRRRAGQQTFAATEEISRLNFLLQATLPDKKMPGP